MGLPFVAAIKWTLVLFLGAFAGRLVWPVGVDETRIASGNSLKQFHYVQVPISDGLGHLNVIDEGPKNGTVMLFLHGFPQSALLSWEHQIGHFAKKGYRVLAPDQRGYNNSYAPKDIRNYHVNTLAKDATEVLAWAKAKTAVVVGHDWGGFVAWRVAELYPEVISKLVILNAPFRLGMVDTLREGWTQWYHSWYIIFFQLPVFPEYKFSANYFAGLRYAILTALPKTFNIAQMKAHISVWSKSLSTMMHWYRATGRASRIASIKAPIQPKTLILWGDQDYFLTVRTAENSLKYCRDAKLEVFKGNTHWISHEIPDKVNNAIAKFIK